MKKVLVKLTAVICLTMTCSGLFAQSKSDKLFETFRNKPGVTYFSFSKDMADAFDINLDDENKNISGDLHEIRFMSYNPEKGGMSGSDFLKKLSGMLPSAYSRVVDTDDHNDAEIWMLGDKKKASEFHVFIKNESTDGNQFLISFFGDFDVNDADGIKEIGLSFSSDK